MDKIIVVGCASNDILAQLRVKYPNEEIIFVNDIGEVKEMINPKQTKTYSIENDMLKLNQELIRHLPKVERISNDNPFPSPHRSSHKSRRY